MTRHRTVNRKPAKIRHATRRSQSAAKAASRTSSSVAELQKQLERQARELGEAREQQAASAEVLRVISSSPGELEPVFEAMLENAVRICGANFGVLYLREGDALRRMAMHNPPPAYVEEHRRNPLIRPSAASGLGRLIATKRVVNIADLSADQAYRDGAPTTVLLVEAAGARSYLGVPMLKDDELIGTIIIYRQEVRPFTDKQIELVQNFAAQAVIAIENARLLQELRESLDRQTATAEILQVINRSPGNLAPVFDAMVERAMRLCEAAYGHVFVYGGELFHLVAAHGEARYVDWIRESGPRPPASSLTFGRIVAGEPLVHIGDIAEDEPYRTGNPRARTIVDEHGIHTLLSVALRKENKLLGTIVLYRQEARPFSDKQIMLVQNFAAQAVVAMENARLLNELRESLEQQTATSEVLKVISSSPGELEPVFNAMLENATRICDAKFGTLFRVEGNAFHLAAQFGTPPELAEFQRQRGPFVPGAGSLLADVMRTKQVGHTADYAAKDPSSPPAKLGGARSFVAVPMLKDVVTIGVIGIYRQEVRPFNDKQIELLTNFASQAVIAIENTRLLNELRQRTEDLTESLEQQTATSEVLRVISTSPGELKPIFDAMLLNAVRLCEAKFAMLFLYEGNDFRAVCTLDVPRTWAEWLAKNPIRTHPRIPMGRAVSTKKPVHVADAKTDQAYLEGLPGMVAFVELGGGRTLLQVPMLKENEVVGMIGIFRQEVRPFTDKQIALVENFAAQAVIAIENTRLLSELRQSLEQQTATADVLKVISRSTFDLQTVFDTLTESAAKVCAAEKGVIFQRDGDLYRLGANYGFSPTATQYALDHPQRAGRQSAVGRVALEGKAIHIPDVLVDPEYTATGYQQAFGFRTILGVPLLREGTTIGVFALTRDKVNPFSQQEIDLVTTFADQAVIAIENMRLLNELRQSLQQQTATADVLKVISRSTFDLQTVLQTLVEFAARLCEAEKAVITRQRGEVFYRAESYGFSAEFMDYVRGTPVVPERGTASGRALLEGRAVHIPDVQADAEYSFEAQRFDAYRTILGVPMLREGIPIGVLALTRSEVRPFTEKQIELVSTFADQAAIAIENVRLFEAEQQRTVELAQSLEDLRTAQDRLVQTEKLASLGQLTAGIAHEIKNPLNFVNNFSAVSVELIDELRQALGSIHLDNKVRLEINEIADTLQGNLDKVVQHGKRADAIVKNMLLHSRQGSGEHRPVDVNALVEESLNLAYHGARAEKQGFEITLERSFDPAAGEADLFPQEITRALLNLISNGFYAANKRKAETKGGNYEPTLAAATKNLGDSVEIRIRDNGTGIPPEVKEKLFSPFFTTKPAGEGTGLGLSISHDIIVKQHGGTIDVDTVPGEFTEFRIVLPRTGMALTKPEERAGH